MSTSLKELAREREARRATARGETLQRPSATPKANKVAAKQVPTVAEQRALLQAHPSVLKSRSVALVVMALTLIVYALVGGWRVPLGGLTIAILLARNGAGWLHGILPSMLRQGNAPDQSAISSAAQVGLFSAQLLSSPGSCAALESKVA